MTTKKTIFDENDFAIEVNPEVGVIRILWRGEVFASISLPILAACVQDIIKRMESSAINDKGRRQ